MKSPIGSTSVTPNFKLDICIYFCVCVWLPLAANNKTKTFKNEKVTAWVIHHGATTKLDKSLPVRWTTPPPARHSQRQRSPPCEASSRRTSTLTGKGQWIVGCHQCCLSNSVNVFVAHLKLTCLSPQYRSSAALVVASQLYCWLRHISSICLSTFSLAFHFFQT